jgi:hypothetical protein
MSKYVNYKSQAFIKLIRKMYMINQENNIKKQMNNILNDPEKIELIKNINLDK